MIDNGGGGHDLARPASRANEEAVKQQEQIHEGQEAKRLVVEQERKRGPGKRSFGGRPYGAKASSVPPKVVEAEAVVGSHMPKLLRELMTTFPRTMRIPSLVTTLRFILTLFMEKIKNDEECTEKGQPFLTLPQFCYFFLVKKYGNERLADVHLTQLQLAVLHHRDHRRCQLLGKLFGCFDVSRDDAPPPLGKRDAAFLFRVLKMLRKLEIFTDQAIEVCERGGMNG